MADPVSTMDVEDVLSSIRRLVSEEAKSNESPEPPKPVAVKDVDIPKVEEKADPDQTEPAESEKPLAAVANATIARQHDVGLPPSNDFEPESTVQETRLDDITEQEEQRSLRNIKGSEEKLVLTDALRVAEEDTAQGSAGDKRSSEPPVLQAVSAVSDAGSGKERRSTPRPKPFQFSSDDTLFERATKAMDALKVEDEAVGITPQVQRPRKAAQQPGSPAESEPKPVADDPAGVVEAPTETTEAQTEAADSSTEEKILEDADKVFNFVEEVPIIEEEALRDLIADMVREELQGELGNRITRNVRKLVRREIQRATASREFE